jgi:hypothetical protein
MNIDSIKRCALIGAVLIGTSLSLPATADSHGGGHGGHGGGWHSGGPAWWGVGIGLGLGWEAAHIASPYYYPTRSTITPPRFITTLTGRPRW